MSDIFQDKNNEHAKNKTDMAEKLVSTSGLLSSKDDPAMRSFGTKVMDAMSVLASSQLPADAAKQAMQHAQDHPMQLGTQVLTGVAIGAGLACVIKNPAFLGKTISNGIIETAERTAPGFLALGTADWSLRIGMPLAHAHKTGDINGARAQLAHNVGVGALEYAAGGVGAGIGVGIGSRITLRPISLLSPSATEAVLSKPFNDIVPLTDAEAMSAREFEIRQDSRIHHRWKASDGRGTALQGAHVKVVDNPTSTVVRDRFDAPQAGATGIVTDLEYAFPERVVAAKVTHADGKVVPYAFDELSPAVLRPDIPVDPRVKPLVSDKPLSLAPGDKVLTTANRPSAVEVDPTHWNAEFSLKSVDGRSRYSEQASEVQRSGRYSLADSTKKPVDALEGDILKISEGHWIPPGEYEVTGRRYFLDNETLYRKREIHHTLYNVKDVDSQGALLEGKAELIRTMDFRYKIPNEQLTGVHFSKIEPLKLSPGDTLAVPKIDHSPIKDDWRWESLKGRALEVEQVSPYGAVLADSSGRQRIAIPADFLQTPYAYPLIESRFPSVATLKAGIGAGAVFSAGVGYSLNATNDSGKR